MDPRHEESPVSGLFSIAEAGFEPATSGYEHWPGGRLGYVELGFKRFS